MKISKQQDSLIAFIRDQGVRETKWPIRVRRAQSARELVEIMEDLYCEDLRFNFVDIDEVTGAGARLENGETSITILLRGDVEVKK